MILYTMMPQELVYPQSFDSSEQQQLVSIDGIPVLVERTEDRSLQVIRLLSTDPQHYLDSRFQPGAKISSESLF